jgi:hypothetical protein
MSRLVTIFAILGAAGAVGSVQAQNLLVNGDLNSTPAFVYYDGSDPAVADDVPGWIISLGAQDGSYVQVSSEPDPLAGGWDADMGIGPGGGGLSTAPLSRPAVIPGQIYTASVTSDNYFGANTTSYFVDWFDGLGTLLSSNGGPLTDPSGPFVYTPYTQLFSFTAAAPLGSASAGVRFHSGDSTYNGLAADNFSLSKAPEPSSAVLMALAVFGLVGPARRKR